MNEDKNNVRIKYLEIDENTYIENDEIKTIIDESHIQPKFVSWDEFWDNLYNRIAKIKEYDETHNKNS